MKGDSSMPKIKLFESSIAQWLNLLNILSGKENKAGVSKDTSALF